MMATLGIAVIGQAPRDDIAAIFAAALPPDTRIVVRGCLDGLRDAEVDALPPRDGDDTLYTRLRGTRDVKISKAAVIERAPVTLDALRRDGADALLFACTGAFPPMRGDAGVVFPSRILAGLAAALLPTGRLGLLVPAPEQIGKLSKKWQRPGIEIAAEALLPSASTDEAEAAAARLAAHRPDLIAMDCMSYTPETRAALRRVVDAPALLAVSTTARLLQELLA
ncbi:MAG: AroM family protein [Microvirga sp.]|jgi:protein AroM|nr:AroM family protein [Beijerinckiaceae bacterium]